MFNGASQAKIAESMFKHEMALPRKFGDFVIDQEMLHEHWGEFLPHFEAQWHETENYLGVPYNPPIEFVLGGDALGTILAFTARKDGTLIGYLIIHLHPSPHVDDCTAATEYLTYVLPEYRKQGIGGELVNFAEGALIDKNISGLYICTKTPVGKNKAGLDSVLKKNGYTHMINQYYKPLTGA